MGKNPRILNSGETSKKEYKCLWDTITKGDVWQGEFHNKKKSGEISWEEASIEQILDKQGKITHFLAIKEDITKRKLNEMELSKHREHLEELIKERTSDLENKNNELKRFNKLFVGREFRIKELKTKLESLSDKKS